jgi:hypothetical protein
MRRIRATNQFRIFCLPICYLLIYSSVGLFNQSIKCRMAIWERRGRTRSWRRGVVEGVRNIAKTFSRNSLLWERDLNRVALDYKSEALPLESPFLFHLLPKWIKVKILWHVVPLLGNEREINDYTTSVTRQWPVNSKRGKVFSVQSVPRCYKLDKLGVR